MFNMADFLTKIRQVLQDAPVWIQGLWAFVVLTICLIIWQIPEWQVSSIPDLSLKESAELADKIRDTLFKGLSGLFFFITASLTAFLTYRNVQSAEQKQISERFSKAIEHLASEQITVRLGGIYSLERIVRDSPADHWIVIEVLTTFIKEKSVMSVRTEHKGIELIERDVQAVLNVLNRRDRNNDKGKIDLSDANLRSANFGGFNFAGSDLQRANLCEANLSYANLSYANLHEANLSGTNCCGALLEMTDLSNANLSKANLSAVFIEANLEGTNLKDANLVNANLEKANLQGAILEGADLAHTTTIGPDEQSGGEIIEVIEAANFNKASHLTPEQIKLAKNWKLAFYSESFRQELGL
jgi:hypothetical protein